MKCRCIDSLVLSRTGQGWFTKGMIYNAEYRDGSYYVINECQEVKFYDAKWSLFKHVFSDYFEIVEPGPEIMSGKWISIESIRDEKIDNILR